MAIKRIPRLRLSRPYATISQTPTATPATPDNLGNVSEAVSHVPTVTGAGPFADQPKFSVLGNPASLLSVSLPASSTLYTRRGSVLLINGDLTDLVTQLAVKAPATRLGLPLVYQKIVAASPVSVLISGAKRAVSESYAVINPSPDTAWILPSRRALLAWSGAGLSVGPLKRSFKSLFGRQAVAIGSSNIVLSGKGSAAVSGAGQLFKVELKATDEYVIHPKALVAHSVPFVDGKVDFTTAGEFTKISHISRPEFNIPRISVISKLRLLLKNGGSRKAAAAEAEKERKARDSLAEAERVAEEIKQNDKTVEVEVIPPKKATQYGRTTMQVFSNMWQAVKNSARWLLWGNDVFYRIKGPATLIVQSEFTPGDRLVAPKELDSLYTK